jgi:hypothetical protein
MTTPASGSQLTSICNGVSRTFNCPVFRLAGELNVSLLTSADQANEDGTLLSPAADYTVAGDGPGGTAQITTTVTYPVGKFIRVWRHTSRAQTNDYVANDGFPAKAQEGALDRLSLVDEELDDAIQAGLKAEAAARMAGDAAVLSITGVAFIPTRAALSAITPTEDGQAVVLSERGYAGLVVWRLGDFTANFISDPAGQLYFAANTIPTSVGAWVRELRDMPQPLAPPAGFDWIPPISIFRLSDGTYVTDFNADLWKVPATASLYVATTGNDATGNGTQGNPYKTSMKAIAVAATLADEDINIFVAAGEYAISIQNLCDKNVNMIATGGRVLATNKVGRTGWVLDAGAYKANLLGFNANGGVRDARYPVTWPNGEQTPQFLALAASKAACQATPSTYFTDGAFVWVHLSDGRVPDADTGQDVGVIHMTNQVLITNTGRKYYFEGFDFEGGQSFNVQPAVLVSVARVVLNDCTYRFAALSSFAMQGTDLAILNNVRSFQSGDDAFGYTPIAPGNPPTKGIEINCRAYHAATVGSTTTNGSTNHGDGRTVRINGQYRDTQGPLVADVSTVQSWCLGVDAQNSLMTSNDKQDACFVSGNDFAEGVRMWLDGCITGGSFYDFYVGPGSTIKYRNMALPPSVGGAGSVTPY